MWHGIRRKRKESLRALRRENRDLRRGNRDLRGKLEIAERLVVLFRDELYGGGRPAEAPDAAEGAAPNASAGKTEAYPESHPPDRR